MGTWVTLAVQHFSLWVCESGARPGPPWAEAQRHPWQTQSLPAALERRPVGQQGWPLPFPSWELGLSLPLALLVSSADIEGVEMGSPGVFSPPNLGSFHRLPAAPRQPNKKRVISHL